MNIPKSELWYDFKYVIESCSGSMKECRYLNEFQVEIYEMPDEDYPTSNELVGKAKFYQILIDACIDDGFSLYQLFDHSQPIFDLAETIFDFESSDLNEEIESFFQDSFNTNICFLEKIEILPEYRNLGLAKKLIRDIYLRFTGGCKFMVLKAVPLQFDCFDEENNFIPKNDWDRAMKYDEMDTDFEKAELRLFAFYQKLGFENHLKNEYFFINPALKNPKMDAIEF